MSIMKVKHEGQWKEIPYAVVSTGVLDDAPIDDKTYARKNKKWSEVPAKEDFATVNGKPIIDGGNIKVPTFIPHVATNGDLTWTEGTGDTPPTKTNIMGPSGATLPGNIEIVQQTGQATDKILSQKAVQDNYVDKKQIVQELGTGTGSENNVISQKVVSEKLSTLEDQFNVSSVYPTQGDLGDVRYSFNLARTKVPDERKKPGLSLVFLGMDSIYNCWVYKGGGFEDDTKWVRNDIFTAIQYSDRILNILAGDVNVDFVSKVITLTSIKCYNLSGKAVITGDMLMSNCSKSFADIDTSATIPQNAIVLINPAEKSNVDRGLIITKDYNKVFTEVLNGWHIIGTIRTVEKKFFANVDVYRKGQEKIHNSISEDFINNISNKMGYIVYGDVSIDFTTKILSYKELRLLSDKGESLLNGDSLMKTASINFESIYNSSPNVPSNGAILINPKEKSNASAGIKALVYSDDLYNYLKQGWCIIAFIRTVQNEFVANIKSYIKDGELVHNDFKESYLGNDFRMSLLKYVSPAAIKGIQIPFKEKCIIRQNGKLENSSLRVSDFVPAFPGMILKNLRTPGDISIYCAVIYYGKDNKVVGFYNGDAGSTKDYRPNITDDIYYLRFTTDKNTIPTVATYIEPPKKEKKTIFILGSSSAQRMEDDSIVGEFKLDKLVEANLVWSGVGGENMQAVVARGAVTPIFPKSAFTIPASSIQKVEIKGGFLTEGKPCAFTNQQGYDLPKLNPVSVCGVRGRILLESGIYSFKRLVNGDAVDVLTTDVFTTNNVKYRGNSLIAMLGYNGGYTDTNDYVRYHDMMVQSFNASQFLFITRLCDGSWTNISKMQEEETALKNKYGGNVLCLRDYLSRFGMRDAIKLGLLSTETSQDISDKEKGFVPTSLRGDGPHLNSTGYKVLSVKIAEMVNQFVV